MTKINRTEEELLEVAGKEQRKGVSVSSMVVGRKEKPYNTLLLWQIHRLTDSSLRYGRNFSMKLGGMVEHTLNRQFLSQIPLQCK